MQLSVQVSSRTPINTGISFACLFPQLLLPLVLCSSYLGLDRLGVCGVVFLVRTLVVAVACRTGLHYYGLSTRTWRSCRDGPLVMSL